MIIESLVYRTERDSREIKVQVLDSFDFTNGRHFDVTIQERLQDNDPHRDTYSIIRRKYLNPLHSTLETFREQILVTSLYPMPDLPKDT